MDLVYLGLFALIYLLVVAAVYGFARLGKSS